MKALDIKVVPLGADIGSSLHMVRFQGKDVKSFVGYEARIEANKAARDLENEAYDRIDAERKKQGRAPVSRPNLFETYQLTTKVLT